MKLIRSCCLVVGLLSSFEVASETPRDVCSVSASELEAYLRQDFNTFDQSKDGWRKLFSDPPRCFLEVAQVIDVYRLHHLSDLKEGEQMTLSWHAGQTYAFAGAYAIALARFEQCRHKDEPANSSSRWNAYVESTLAFLKRDLVKLKAKREELAGGSQSDNLANLKKVDGLIKCFNKSYREAYIECPKAERGRDAR